MKQPPFLTSMSKCYDFHLNLCRSCSDHTLFMTVKGYMEMAPGYIDHGDMVALISGFSKPAIIWKRHGRGYEFVVDVAFTESCMEKHGLRKVTWRNCILFWRFYVIKSDLAVACTSLQLASLHPSDLPRNSRCINGDWPLIGARNSFSRIWSAWMRSDT